MQVPRPEPVHRRHRADRGRVLEDQQGPVQVAYVPSDIRADAVFRVADISRRGLVSWEEFVVFETCTSTPKRSLTQCSNAPTPTISSRSRSLTATTPAPSTLTNSNRSCPKTSRRPASVRPPLPYQLTVAFDFDVPWMKLYVGRQGGRHVLACKSPTGRS